MEVSPGYKKFKELAQYTFNLFIKFLTLLILGGSGIVLIIYLLNLMTLSIAALILDYLRVLAWPSIVLVFILIFRLDIRKMFERLKELENPLIGKGTFASVEEQKVQQQEMVSVDEDFIEPEVGEAAPGSQDIEDIKSQLEVARRELMFERIHRIIFKSQYELLSSISALPMPFALVDKFYKDVQQKNSPTLDSRDLMSYIGFLTGTGLAEWLENNSQLLITGYGREYLAYVIREGYSAPTVL